MITCVRISPRGDYILIKQPTPPPPYFVWNCIIDKVNSIIFRVENRVSSKFKKEGVTLIRSLYIIFLVR